jgi:hypothetical protein
VNFLDKYFVAFGVFFNFGDHDFIEEVDLPEFLIVAAFLVILGVDCIELYVLGSVE